MRQAENIYSGIGISFVLLVLLIPIISLPGFHHFYDVTPKTTCLYTAAALAAWWLALRGYRGVRSNRCQFMARITLATLTYVAALTASTAMSTCVGLSLGGTLWRRVGYFSVIACIGIGFSIGRWTREDSRNMPLFLRLSVVVGCIVGITSIFQVAVNGLTKTFTASTGIVDIVFRPPATLGHATYYATFLIFPLCAGLALLTETGSNRGKTILWWAIGLLILSIVVSGSRSAVIGVATAISLFIFLAWKTEGNLISRQHVIGCIGILGLIVLGSIWAPSIVLRDRIDQWFLDLWGGPRLLVLGNALSTPDFFTLLGTGLETFPRQFALHQSSALLKAYPDHFHESAHNLFVEILIEQGLVCGASLAWLLVLIIRHITSGTCNTVVLCACGPAVLGMGISLQFIPLTITNLLYLSVLIGVMCFDSTSADSMQISQREHSWVSRTVYGVGGLAFAFLGVYLERGDRLHARLDQFIERRDFNRAAAALRKVDDYSRLGESPEYEIYRKLSPALSRESILRQLDINSTQVLRTVERAADTSSQPFNVFLFAGYFAYKHHDFKSAEMFMLKAAEAFPTWHKPRVGLMLIYQKLGHINAAEREKESAVARADGRALEHLEQLRYYLGE
jgi:hypothetical protein